MSVAKLVKSFKTFSSGVKAVDRLVGGWFPPERQPALKLPEGWPIGALIELVGQPRVGKTIFSNQLIASLVKETGKNALYLDTEGGNIKTGTALYWIGTFAKRFDVNLTPLEVVAEVKRRNTQDKTIADVEIKPVEKVEGENFVFLMDVRDIVTILALHGRFVAIEYSEKGKVNVRIEKMEGFSGFSIENTAIGKFIKENNVGIVVYDSTATPIKGIMSLTNQSNYPARAQLYYLWFSSAQLLANHLDVTAIAINHTVQDPTRPSNYETGFGGVGTGYNFKYSVAIRAPFRKDEKSRIRRFVIVRHPFKESYGWYCHAMLTAEGFVDLPERGIDRVKAGPFFNPSFAEPTEEEVEEEEPRKRKGRGRSITV